MENPKKTRALEHFRPYLRLLEAYNSEHFHHRDWRSLLCRISYALCATAMVLLLPIYVSLAIWHLIETSVDLKTFVAQIPIQYSLLQMTVILTTLVAKNRTIAETLTKLQHLIDQREFARQIYVYVEKKHGLFSNWLMRLALVCLAIVYLLITMPPILHAMVGYPPPQYWVLPLETQ